MWSLGFRNLANTIKCAPISYSSSLSQMLSKKVDTLSKAMEVEAKKMRREVTVMEKEVAAMRVDKDQDRRTRRLSLSKEPVNSSSQRLSGR